MFFKKYPTKCPFCHEKKKLAKDWKRFPNNILDEKFKRQQSWKAGRLSMLTDQAEDEWFSFIVCFSCYRIIWYRLDPNRRLPEDIPLPRVEKLTGWKDIPFSPIVLHDKTGNPVYGTKRSREIYG